MEDLSAQVKSLRGSLEQETLNKVDLQNNIQSLKEEMAFMKRIHEEVIREGKGREEKYRAC